jgi:hypothetical protein
MKAGNGWIIDMYTVTIILYTYMKLYTIILYTYILYTYYIHILALDTDMYNHQHGFIQPISIYIYGSRMI